MFVSLSMVIIFLVCNFEKLVPLADEYRMTHILQLCDKNLLKQPPSIGRLVLAETYHLTELWEVYLKYAKSTPLETVKHHELYDQVDSATKVEILDHNLGIMAKKVEDGNKGFQRIQQLSESQHAHSNNSSMSHRAHVQIKQICNTKGHDIPKPLHIL